jgi:hypothetical protein
MFMSSSHKAQEIIAKYEDRQLPCLISKTSQRNWTNILMLICASDSRTVCWRSTSQPTYRLTTRQYDAATYEYYVALQTDGFYITFLHVHHFTKLLLEAEASSDELSYKRKREKCKTTKTLFTNCTLSAHWEKMDSGLFHSWFPGHQCNVRV